MPEIKQDIRGMTLVVASPTSLHANDADYVCNGTPSQNAQTIQDAINLCTLMGGGTVKVLEGEILLDHRAGTTYSVIAMKDNVHLSMSPGTILKLADGAVGAGDTGHPIIDSWDEGLASAGTNFRISGGVIDGNKLNQNPTFNVPMNLGIWIRTVTTVAGHRAIFLDNITVHDTISGGFYFEELVAQRLAHQNVFGSHLVAHDCGLVAVLTSVGGFHFDDVSHVILDDILSFNNYRGVMIIDSCFNTITNFKSNNNDYGLHITRALDDCHHNRVDIYSDGDDVGVYLEGGAGQIKVFDEYITGHVENQVGISTAVWGRYIKRCRFEMEITNCLAGPYIRDASECVFDFDVYNITRNNESGGNFSSNFNHNTVRGRYELARADALGVNGQYNLITAVCKDGSQQANNAYAEIRVGGSYNTVKVVCRSTQANKAKYSYQESAGDYNYVSGCVFQGAVTKAIGYPGETGVLGANTIAYDNKVDHFQDILAADVNHVRAAEDLSVAVPITFTIDAQPDVPRTISWTMTHVNIAAFTLVITGYTSKGQYIAETFTEAGGWAGETSNAFAVISSIQLTARTGTGVGDTMDVGIGSKLGLANRIYATAHVIKVQKNGAHYPAASYTVNATYDTVDVSTGGAIVAGDDFSIWYRACMNIIA